MKRWGISWMILAGIAGGMMIRPCFGEEVTLKFWHTMNEKETPALESIVKEFEAAHPDIHVQLEFIPFTEAQTKFQVAAETGQAPDVMRAEITWTPFYADEGFLLELDSYLSPEDHADYLEIPFAYNQYHGKTYGLPHVTDVVALLYNKRLLKEAGHETPPTTFAEFEQTAADVKAKLGIEGFYMRAHAHWFLCFLWAFGGEMVNADGEIVINSAPSVKALEYLVSQKDRLFPGNTDFSSEYNDMMTAFKEGKSAMLMQGPWATADILSGPAFADPNNLGIAPFPKGPEGEQGSPVGGHNYVISADTPYPDQAYELIQFINQAQYQAQLNARINLLPTRRSAYEFPEVKNNALAQGFLRQMLVARNRPVIPQGWQLYTALTPAIRDAWRGVKTPQQAMDEVAAAWKDLLAQ